MMSGISSVYLVKNGLKTTLYKKLLNRSKNLYL